eukprot:6468273-Ditylum_brightwellii.AAC.1
MVLLGFKDNTVPTTVDENSLLEVSKDDVTRIELLLEIKNEDEVFRQKKTTAQTNRMKICNSIVLPPWLAKVLIQSKAGTMGEAFIIVLRVSISKDTIEAQQKDIATMRIGKNVKDITLLLQNLYCWAQDTALWDLEGKVTTNAAFDKDVLEWSDEMHERFITNQVNKGKKSIYNNTMKNLEGTLTELKGEIKGSL